MSFLATIEKHEKMFWLTMGFVCLVLIGLSLFFSISKIEYDNAGRTTGMLNYCKKTVWKIGNFEVYEKVVTGMPSRTDCGNFYEKTYPDFNTKPPIEVD